MWNKVTPSVLAIGRKLDVQIGVTKGNYGVASSKNSHGASYDIFTSDLSCIENLSLQ